MLRGEKWDYPIKSEMSYFRLWLILHYCRSHCRLTKNSKRNNFERLIDYLLVVVSSVVLRPMPDKKSFPDSQGLLKVVVVGVCLFVCFLLFFFQLPHFLKCIFYSFRTSLIQSLNLKKHFSDRFSYIHIFLIAFFFSDWTILWYKSSLNRGVQWSANSSL